MTVLSESAQKLYDRYLQQVRSLLRWSDSADADEVEEDVREHIEQELSGKEGPVSAKELDDVLEQLGNPRQWIQAEELNWWRRFILSLWDGPEDWRLAWISFGLLLIGFLFDEVFLVFLIASFCVSRAALSLGRSHDELRSQKWLIYPSMVIVCVLAGLWILFWPMAFLSGIRTTGTLSYTTQIANPLLLPFGSIWWIMMGRQVIFAGFVLLIVTGVWWIVLGLLYPKIATPFHVLFDPIISAETLDRWARCLKRIGIYLILLVIALAFLAALIGVAVWLFGGFGTGMSEWY